MALYITSACEEKSRSHDTSEYDEHAENFDANTDQMDYVAYGRRYLASFGPALVASQ